MLNMKKDISPEDRKRYEQEIYEALDQIERYKNGGAIPAFCLDDDETALDTFASAYPVLTVAGVCKRWKKSRTHVIMSILKDQIDAYKDGAIWMVITSSVIARWGKPTHTLEQGE